MGLNPVGSGVRPHSASVLGNPAGIANWIAIFGPSYCVAQWCSATRTAQFGVLGNLHEIASECRTDIVYGGRRRRIETRLERKSR